MTIPDPKLTIPHAPETVRLSSNDDLNKSCWNKLFSVLGLEGEVAMLKINTGDAMLREAIVTTIRSKTYKEVLAIAEQVPPPILLRGIKQVWTADDHVVMKATLEADLEKGIHKEKEEDSLRVAKPKPDKGWHLMTVQNFREVCRNSGEKGITPLEFARQRLPETATKRWNFTRTAKASAFLQAIYYCQDLVWENRELGWESPIRYKI